jgi:YD repeat-containing protein
MFLNSSAQSPTIAPNKDFYKPSDVLPKAPESSGLFKYSPFPVDHASGGVNVSIPIHTIRAGRIELPVSISYNTSGIKVQDVASMVGLGWNLNFGYCISVSEEELKLFTNQGRQYKNEADALGVSANDRGVDWLNEMKRTADGYYPTLKTIYKYSCGNLSGTFFYDDLNRLRLAGEQMNVKIEKLTTSLGGLVGFKVTTGDAIEYIFDQQETTTRVSQDDPSLAPQTTAFWCSKITDLISGDKVTFTYVQKPVYEDYSNETYTFAYGNLYNTLLGCDWNPSEYNYSFTKYDVQGLQISKIEFPDGTILFNADQTRQDIDKTRITSIGIYSTVQQNSKKRQVSFHQSYFQSSGGSKTAYNYRLRLDSLTIQPVYQQVAATAEKYTFAYNTTQLPPYRVNTFREVNSTAVDYWGYYNGQNGGQRPIPTKVYNDMVTGLPYSQLIPSTINREANPLYTQAGVLTQVNYPTGGYASFEFENHQLPNYYLGSTLGGLRIKRLKYYESALATVPAISKTYNYLSVKDLTPASEFMYSYVKRKAFIGDELVPGDASKQCPPNPTVWMSNNSLYGIAYYHGSPVFYDKVEELEGTEADNIGKTIYYNKVVPTSYTSSTFKENGGRKLIPYDRGNAKPESIETYKKVSANTYDLVAKQTFEYINATPDSVGTIHGTQPGGNSSIQVGFGVSKNDDLGIQYPPEKFIGGGPISMDLVGPNADNYFLAQANQHWLPVNTFLYNDWFIYPGYLKLAAKHNFTYNNGVAYETTERYYYDSPHHQQLTRKETVNSQGLVEKVVYKYMKDWYDVYDINDNSNTPLINALARANYADQLLQEEYYVNNVLVNKNKNEFVLMPNPAISDYVPVVNARKTYNYAAGSEGEQKLNILKYNNRFKIVSQQLEKGPVVSNLWDDMSANVTAQATNADYNDIYYTSFESKATGRWIFSGPSQYDANAYTGGYVFDLSGKTISTAGNLPLDRTYILSYRSRNGSYTVSGTLSIQNLGTVKGWTLYVHKVKGESTINITGAGLIDELKFYPENAQMTTFTHDHMVGMTSQTDAKGQTTYYEYDPFQRLMNIRDQNGHIVKHMDYHYKGL